MVLGIFMVLYGSWLGLGGSLWLLVVFGGSWWLLIVVEGYWWFLVVLSSSWWFLFGS